ncbi:hypothetical protein KY495_18795 [Massilia sp. PAMC28688]|uniref:hypothetical protein n=1 Tax=Massilia sp. PAMC28688 TaxID=2861283 RepID=UPI001C62E7DB|nr:hypothetical protein [Massilia sp. PAMC28688]QYF92756.1 hypothetical protein KY495_18795 [Massilia sp. PAMC28688]
MSTTKTQRPATVVKVLNNGAPVVKGQMASHAGAHGRDNIEPNAFAPLRQNNKVRFFTTGKEYFKVVCAAMLSAKSSIFIAGWQVNWDVELTPGMRLLDVLHNRVQSSDKFRVFVMPWLSPKIGLDTLDLETMLAVFHLNAGRKTMQAMCCPAGGQSDLIGTEGAAFSHHQKLVVIDNKIAYIGGIDLAYGRCDDERFSLNHEGRRLNERYNPGIPALQAVRAEDGPSVTTMDLLLTTVTAGHWKIGGNSAPAEKDKPGALMKYLTARMAEADQLALDAVAVVNSGMRLTKERHASMVKSTKVLVKSSLNGAANTAIDAARAVSSQCAAWQVPDLYGTVASYKVNPRPVSGMGTSVRNMEENVIETYNQGVAKAREFLEPLGRLEIDPKTTTGIPGALDDTERTARGAVNASVGTAARAAGVAQEIAKDGRDVCVQIAPSVAHGVASAKSSARDLIAAAQRMDEEASQTISSINAAIEHGLNILQGAVIDEINAARRVLNDKVLQAIEVIDEKTLAGIRSVSQEKFDAVIKQFMRLAKVVYLAQIALAWVSIKPNEKLLSSKTKSSVKGNHILKDDQPREPWQDVHSEIVGPAVADVARNFIDRWNSAQFSYLRDGTIRDLTEALGLALGPTLGIVGKVVIKGAGHAAAKAGGDKLRQSMMIPSHLVPPVLPVNPKKDGTGESVRILRSAALKLCKDEARAKGLKIMPTAAQAEIQTQMLELIKNATDFIYIENQFFQSAFGDPTIEPFTIDAERRTSGPMRLVYASRMNRIKSELSGAGFAAVKKALPKNEIGKEIADRIAKAIRLDQPFHVYIVLPVHPEGRMDDITIMGQIHWTMQSLIYADLSLVNRIKRSIAAKKMLKPGLISDAAWGVAYAKAGIKLTDHAPYESVSEEEWSKYLTLLNLRTCEKVDGLVRTEQIYVHSKLLIVDDRHVLLGSANINDRSQNGGRDSEIAMVMLGSSSMKATLGSRATSVNPLARKLRVDLWQKHFAIGAGNEFVHPVPAAQELLDTPALESTYRRIQALSRANAKTFEANFPHIPVAGNGRSPPARGVSIWPVCPAGVTAQDAAEHAKAMPFHHEFWTHLAGKRSFEGKAFGFISKLPTFWTVGEYNHPGEMSVGALTLRPDIGTTSQTAVG